MPVLTATSISGRRLDTPRFGRAVMACLLAAAVLPSEAGPLARGANPTGSVAVSSSLRIDMPASPYTVSEGVGAVRVLITRDPASAGTRVSAHYHTVPGTAFPGVDFTEVQGVAELGPDESRLEVLVPVTNDSRRRQERYFHFRLFVPLSDGGSRVLSSLRIVIRDNDLGFGFAESVIVAEAREGDGKAVLAVWRGTDGPELVTVDFETRDGTARAGADYVAMSGTLTFAPGEDRTKFVEVPLLVDVVPEADKTFEMVLLRPSTNSFLGTNFVGTVIIHDDDLGVVVEAATNRVREDAGVFVASVRKETNPPRETSVGYRVDGVTATAGEDFVAVSGRLDFGPLESRKTIEIPILNDFLMEGPESFTVTLTDSTGVPLGEPSRLRATLLDTSSPGASAVAPVRFDSGPLLMAPQADGRVVVGGMFLAAEGLLCQALCRLLADGSFDPEFRRGSPIGIVQETQFNPWGTLSIDPRGRIVVAGLFSGIDGMACPGVFRLQPDGSLDRSFAPGYPGRAFAADGLAEGGVVVAGATNRPGSWIENVEVFKLTETGGFSPDFRTARLGWQGGNINYGYRRVKVKEMRDGRLLITHATVPGEPAPRWPVVRLLADGTIDSAYTPPAGGMLLSYAVPLADGSVFVTTRTNVCPFADEPGRCGFLFRLRLDGSIDSRFRPPAGRGPITALATYPDGRLLVAYDDDGEHDPIAVERLLAEGTVDPSFGPVWYGEPTVWSLAALPDGRAFAGALAPFALNQLPRSALFILSALSPPRIAEARRLPGGGLRLSVACGPAARYTLEGSADLTGWRPMETRTASKPGIVFETARRDAPEFYRVRREAD